MISKKDIKAWRKRNKSFDPSNKMNVLAIFVILMTGCFVLFQAENISENTYTNDIKSDITSSNIAVFDAETPTLYSIWIDGQQITSENKDNLCNGKASYNPETHTLFLKDAVLDSDISSDYAIKTIVPNLLTIKLSGTNTITRTYDAGGMAISSSESILITGDGKLIINSGGETYDCISVNKNLTVAGKANLVINAAGGCGIVTSGTVTIDGATLNSTGLYAGIDSRVLKIMNGSDVTLCATQDKRNAAYIWKDDDSAETQGIIEITSSKVKATSYYPALFANVNMILDSSNINCTSTADSAIWSRGDITVKGGTELILDTKFAIGCVGTFTIEKANIDVKNTNADGDKPAMRNFVIAEGYELKSAKAINFDGTEVDLLPGDIENLESYKSICLVTKAPGETSEETSDSSTICIVIGSVIAICVVGFVLYRFVIKK